MASWQATARRADLRHGSVRPARPRPVPVPARRVSGPRSRPAGSPPGTLRGPLRPQPVAPLPSARSFDRVRALPDHRFLDRLLRSRAWIWLIGIGLGGIVAMQVSMLKLNAGISRAVETSATLERQNAELEGIVAGLASGQRVRRAAQNRGMVLPAAGSIGFLTVRDETDASRALRNMAPPSLEAIALLENGGRVPGALAAQDPLVQAPVAPVQQAAPAAGTTTPVMQPTQPIQQTPPTQATQTAPAPAADPQAATAGGATPSG